MKENVIIDKFCDILVQRTNFILEKKYIGKFFQKKKKNSKKLRSWLIKKKKNNNKFQVLFCTDKIQIPCFSSVILKFMFNKTTFVYICLCLILQFCKILQTCLSNI